MAGLVDFDFMLFEQSSYTIYGVAVVLTLDDTSGTTVDLTAIDETAGTDVLDRAGVTTILPAAAVRAVELAEKNVALVDLSGASLALNGKTWGVVRHGYRPTPNGEGQGEILLVLDESDGA